MEKLFETEEPIIKEYPFQSGTLSVITSLGQILLHLKKTFTVKSSFTQTWMTQHGFDLSVTIGTLFEADAFFASVTSSF